MTSSPVMVTRRMVTLMSTGPGGVVVGVQQSAPVSYCTDPLRTRLEGAERHVAEVSHGGKPIDVAIGEVWITERVIA